MMSQRLTKEPSAAGIDQAKLSERFRAGDDEAFDQVVALYADQINLLARRLCSWDDAAEDIVQDVFVAALANRRRIRGDSKLKTWLFQITINQCRKWKFRRKLFSRFQRDQKKAISGSQSTPCPEPDQYEHVRGAVGSLPRRRSSGPAW